MKTLYEDGFRFDNIYAWKNDQTNTRCNAI